MNEVYEIMAKYGLLLHVFHYPNAVKFVFYQGDVFGLALHCDDPMELIEAADRFDKPDEVRGSYDFVARGSVYSLAGRTVFVPDEEHYNTSIQKAAKELFDARDLTTGISKCQESIDNFETIFEAMR